MTAGAVLREPHQWENFFKVIKHAQAKSLQLNSKTQCQDHCYH